MKPQDLRRVLVLLQRLDLVWGVSLKNDKSEGEETFQVPERILLYENVRSAVASMEKSGHYQVTLRKTPPTAEVFPVGHSFGGPGTPFTTGLTTYSLHPEIEKVSARLFEGKHYAPAVEEAYKRVITEVKTRMQQRGEGINDGGAGLMGNAFGCNKGRIPPIRFNALKTVEEKDEQQGFMYLFMGIVNIRNRKAHENVVLDDSQRAVEYLGLASLLMRLLDLAETLQTESSEG